MRIVGTGSLMIKNGLAGFEESLQILHELGYTEFDMLFISGWSHIGLDELADRYSELCRTIEKLLQRYNLQVASLNAKLSVPIEDEDSEVAKQREQELNAMIRFMQDFGINVASLQPTLTMDQEYLERTRGSLVRETLREQAYFKEQGIILCLEPHIMSSLCTTPFIRQVLEEHPEFRFVYDPSHLLHQGENIRDTAYLIRAAGMVHLRDASPGNIFVPYGSGRLDLAFVMHSLKETGYDGPISLEYLVSEKRDEAVYADLVKFHRAVQEFI